MSASATARVRRYRGLAFSFATRDRRGFADRDLALIDATLPAFALAFKATMAIDTARILGATYLGRDAADRILRGEIDRGHVKPVSTVLWFSDLTGFTRIADTLPREQLLELLNAYADCLVGVVHDHGGEVLKFMGDGILAVFNGDRGTPARSALDAAEAARPAIARLNRGARGRRPARDRLHPCDARRRGALRQRRQPGTARFHRDWPGGQRAQPDSGDEPHARPADPDLGELRRRLRRQRARLVSLGRYALRGVRRAAGTVHPRPRRTTDLRLSTG